MDYLDTSALVPFYWPEIFSDAVEQLVSVSDRLAISQLGQVEFASAAAHKLRLGACSSDQVIQVRQTFSADCRSGALQILPCEPHHWQRSADLLTDHAHQLPLRTLDVLHVSLAHAYGCRLITGDQRQAALAERIGLGVVLVTA